MEELKIVINQELGTISTNFEEVKATLSDQMEIYKELEVTEANKPERKKDVATLRKIIKSVNDKRIEVKNECLKPYMTFEEKAKELIDIINQPIGIIDNQVKEFEEKQRLHKIEEINNIFGEMIVNYPLLQEEIGIAEIYDNRWENATASMKSVKDDIKSKLDKIQADVLLIKSMVSEKTEEALSLFWGDLDVTKAITMINRYEAQKKEIQSRMEEQQKRDRERELEAEKERIKKEAREELAREEKIKEDERNRVMTEQQAKEQAERDAMAIQKQNNQSSMETNIYSITATAEETEQIEMYLDSLGIDWERMC
jgi:hypothetical protein